MHGVPLSLISFLDIPFPLEKVAMSFSVIFSQESMNSENLIFGTINSSWLIVYIIFIIKIDINLMVLLNKLQSFSFQ